MEYLNSNSNNNKQSIKLDENYIDPVFNNLKISFDDIDSNLADINLGGNC